jgi:protein O-mannosyl-transferase
MARGRKKAPVMPVPAARVGSRATTWWVAALLAAITVVAFAGVRDAGFVQLDDPVYVSENPRLGDGLTLDAIAWAFTTFTNANWHPLTWLSHLIDVQLFGLNPGGHHLTNLALHTANGVLLFFVLLALVAPDRPTTADLARSGFVAALFAVHPLHVESVAWISERKDVLSTLFWILTMWAYVRYVRRPGGARYAVVALVFALGLMAKPMLVTLPFVLLLLDIWPLQRLTTFRGRGPTSLLRRLFEKAPLIFLSAASSVVTVIAQQQGGAVMSLEAVPFALRIQNAAVSFVAYLGQALWPANLAAFYPQRAPSIALVAFSVMALSTITVAVVVAWRRRNPAPAVGWFWYLGTLVPVIGLVQVGRQAMADRYTYVPFIGLFIAMVWAVPRLAVRRPLARAVLAAAATAILVACVVVTRAQVRHWHSNTALWERALDVTLGLGRDRARLLVAGLTLDGGRVAEPIARFFQPDADRARLDAAGVLLELGHRDAALRTLHEVIGKQPLMAAAHEHLGRALAATGRTDAAVASFLEALRLDPTLQSAHANLGRIHGDAGRFDRAAQHLSQAVTLNPRDARARCDFGLALTHLGQFDEALAQFGEALKLDPTLPELHNNLGLARAGQGHLAESVPYFREAVRLRPSYADALRNLAIAEMRLGRADAAIRSFQELLRLRPGDAAAREALELLRRSGGG